MTNRGLPPVLLDRAFPYHWTADTESNIIRVGPALSEIIAVGSPVSEWLSPDTSGDLDLSKDATNLVLSVSGTDLVLVGRLFTDDGLVTFLGEPRTAPRTDSERMSRQLRELTDELSRREARLRALVQGTSEVILILDRQGRITWANANVESVLDRAAHIAVGQCFHEWMPAEHRKRFRLLLSKLSGTLDASGELEICCEHDNGAPVHLLVTVQNALANQNVTGFIVNARDITSQRQLWSQLLQTQKMESIGQLAGGIAHDFNNLLMVILLYTDIVADQVGQENQVYEDLMEIKQAAERATTLTRQILAFSRKQTFAATVVQLDDTLDKLNRMLLRLVGEHIVIQTRFDTDLLPVRADPAQVEQAVINLILNGRDAMPDGGVLTLALRNERTSQRRKDTLGNLLPAGRYVSCSVTDHGTGITEGELARIFEPFYTTKPEGTGLGLSTVFGIVAAHAGGLFVETSLGEGTHFALWLPIAEPDLTLPTNSGEETHRIPTGTGTVVLVEDADNVRELTARMLTDLGYTVHHTPDPSAGIEMAVAAEGPVVLLTDMMMPTLKGAELAARAKARRPDLPVLYMSGYTDDMLLDVDPDQLLRKPFTRRDLASRIRDFMP